MMKTITKYKIRESLTTTVVMTIIFLIIHLLFEIITIEQFRGIGFSEGYITLSDKSIGHHVVSYILAMLIGFMTLFFSSDETLK